jgi:hypothetical protein
MPPERQDLILNERSRGPKTVASKRNTPSPALETGHRAVCDWASSDSALLGSVADL